MDTNELVTESQKSEVSPNKPMSTNKIVTNKLKTIRSFIKEVFDYFKKNSVIQGNYASNPLERPIKFLKIYSLLPLQLSDAYFRKIFLIQILIFTYTLKNPSTKSGLTLKTDEEKSIIEEIEKITAEGIYKG